MMFLLKAPYSVALWTMGLTSRTEVTRIFLFFLNNSRPASCPLVTFLNHEREVLFPQTKLKTHHRGAASKCRRTFTQIFADENLLAHKRELVLSFGASLRNGIS